MTISDFGSLWSLWIAPYRISKHARWLWVRVVVNVSRSIATNRGFSESHGICFEKKPLVHLETSSIKRSVCHNGNKTRLCGRSSIWDQRIYRWTIDKKPVVIVGWLSSPHQQTISSALQRSFFLLKAIWKMKLSLLLSFQGVVQFLALLHESHFPLIFIRGSGNVWLLYLSSHCDSCWDQLISGSFSLKTKNEQMNVS